MDTQLHEPKISEMTISEFFGNVILVFSGGFVSFSKSAVLSHFRNRRFCLIFEIGGFVSFSKSAVLSRLQNRRFCLI